MNVQAGSIGIICNFKNIFFRNRPVLSVKVIDLDILIHDKPGTSPERPDLPVKSSRSAGYLESFLRRCITLLSRTARYLPGQIQVENFSLYWNKVPVLSCQSATFLFSHRKRLGKIRFIRLGCHLTGCCWRQEGHDKQPFSVALLRSDSHIEYSTDEFRITEASHGNFNEIPFLYFLQSTMKGEKAIKWAIAVREVAPDAILRSLPFLSTPQIYRTRAGGTLSLQTMFAMTLEKPYKHKFIVEFENKPGSPADAGDLFDYLKGPFVHTVHEREKIIREIVIDPTDHDFTALSLISSLMVEAVVCTEDPRFYTHRGIDSYAFGKSLADNLLERKIVRGGSTITMQLARNLYLHHGRTLSRKLEEMIIAWIIEEICQVPKKRILEIYLNIIEWGPGLYGVQAASAFYFSKLPSQLSLTESLVLTYIIPRPKHFLEALTLQSATLRVNLSKHIQQFAMVMLTKKLITEDVYSGIGDSIVFANQLGRIDLIRD